MAEQNVTAQYPPTILVHGTADTDVPYECSVRMAVRLKRLLSVLLPTVCCNNHIMPRVSCQALFEAAGVQHSLHTIDDAEHGFGGASDLRQIDAAYKAIGTFLALQWGLTPAVIDASRRPSRM